jgi:hypothetical protein
MGRRATYEPHFVQRRPQKFLLYTNFVIVTNTVTDWVVQ